MQIKWKYHITNKVLGHGSFGKVFLAEGSTDPSFKVAIKAVSIRKLGDQMKKIKDEIKILETLDHPNIVKYYETYENWEFLYIVMEYCPGGDLFDLITKRSKEQLKETVVATIMKDLLKALNHCHSSNVVHWDIKPENIMVGEDGHIKLIDFGLSKQNQTTNSKMSEQVGTPYYVAPEVLNGNYTSKCDLWSLGVVFYIMLSGYLPFVGEDADEVYMKIKEGDFTFEHKEFKLVTSDAKDLLNHLLEVNYNKWYSATDALNHPWFITCKKMRKENDIENDKLAESALDSLVNH